MRKSAKLSGITAITAERPRVHGVRTHKYGLSLLRLIFPLLLLPAAALSQEAAAPAVNPAASPAVAPESGTGAPPAAQNRPEEFPRRVAVYVTGGVDDGEKGALGASLLASLVSTGACVGHENSAAFLAAVGEEQSKQKDALDDGLICEIGRRFDIKYVCAVTVTPASGAAAVSAKMLNTETGKARLTGDATGRINTPEELAQVSDAVVGKMLYNRVPAPPQAPPPAVVIDTPLDAAETVSVERNIAQESLGADKAPEPRTWRKAVLRGTAISLDALGVLAFAYGYIENSNVVTYVKHVDDGHIKNGPEADKAAKRRNVAYIVSGVLLASGITIHIFF